LSSSNISCKSVLVDVDESNGLLILFVVDEETIITTYDLQTKLAKGSFSNGNSLKRTFITSFKLINAQHEAMFLTGSDDRIVRLFKPDLVNFKANKLITAFTAFGDNEKKNYSKSKRKLKTWAEHGMRPMAARLKMARLMVLHIREQRKARKAIRKSTRTCTRRPRRWMTLWLTLWRKQQW
jgi:hypothetical protein